MARCSCLAALCLLQAALAVKVKVVMHSEEDSKIEDEDPPPAARVDLWDRNKRLEPTMMPFIKRPAESPDYEEKPTTARARSLHPNDMIFPLIYRQSHINSMFKFGENWYTWSTDKRADGTKVLNYYVCYDEPKRCDDVGWEHTDAVPKCAFQIDSVLVDDRACLNAFGVEPHGASCDGADQIKVSDLVRSCGPRIRSLWRFVRVGRRPPTAAKPADVNSLLCEDEEECFLTIEYRIHHDRITFSLHEPTRGQTFKSVLKRDSKPEEGAAVTEAHAHARRAKKVTRDEAASRKKYHPHLKSKQPESKPAVKERDDSGYVNRRINNRIKFREDISDDISE